MIRKSLTRRRISLSVLGLLPPAAIGVSVEAPSSVAAPTRLATGGESLELEGAPNARDLGGFKVTEGGHVRRGLLLRGPRLNQLSSTDVSKLEALGLSRIIDLRTPEEIKKRPDVSVPGATKCRFPCCPLETR